MFAKLMLLFTHSKEIEQLLGDIRTANREAERISTAKNLNLCIAHRQESNQSHFSEHNCDYCKLQAELENVQVGYAEHVDRIDR